MKKALVIILTVLLLMTVLIPLNLFVIGEPVDGEQLSCDVRQEGNTLIIRMDALSSAMALRGIKVRQEGSTHHISLRKVLVSPLFPSGTAAVRIDMLKTDNVYVGNKLVWSSQ